MIEHGVAKALEVWTLQTLLDFSILLGIMAAGLAMVQAYYRSLEQRLSLRVSVELWRVVTVLAVDVLLVFAVGVGYLVLNPDIMADIKMAIPFCPAATVLFAAALVLRLFHGGHQAGSKNFVRSLYLMLAGNLFNVAGFTLVMEAPSGEFLAKHPSPFWDYVKTHLRSNADPHGLELAQLTFYVAFPILVAVSAWGVRSAFRHFSEVARGDVCSGSGPSSSTSAQGAESAPTSALSERSK
jgi:hypothetical protein